MRLYHGSNMVVDTPRLFKTDRRVDFGPGFYLTSSEEQASKWARVVTRRRRDGVPTISVFEFPSPYPENLDILAFEAPTIDWLRFVGANRSGTETDNHDLVVGPVANDNTMPTLRLYFGGIYTEEETITRLLPQKLHDQFAFRTQRALDELVFIEGVKL